MNHQKANSSVFVLTPKLPASYVSADQHESLCYFGHRAHFILAMYCNISYLFFNWYNFCNTVNVIIFVNSAQEKKKLKSENMNKIKLLILAWNT